MKEKKLGELCDFISGLWTGKKPPYINVGVLRNTNFNKDGTLSFDDMAMLDVEIKQFKSRKLEYGDIILEKSGGGPKQPVGRVCLFDKKEGDFSLSNFTSAIRIKNSDEIYHRYLHYFLYFMYESGETVKIQTNSTGIRNLQLALYKDFLVPLPSLKTQQKIVGKIDLIFSEIDKANVSTEASISNAEALFQSCLTEVFSPSPTKNFIELNEVLVKTKNVSPDKNPDTYFKYVDVSSVSNKDFEITETQYLLGRDAPSRAKKHVQENDVLFATVRPTLKRVAIVPPDLNNEVASTGYVVLRTGNELRSKYLFYFLLSSFFMEKMNELQRGASYPAVTDSDVKNQKINLLSLKEQDAVCSKLDSIFLAKKSIEVAKNKKITELHSLKQAILKQAFNGELVKE